MDVVVAVEEPEIHQVHPAFQLHIKQRGVAFHLDDDFFAAASIPGRDRTRPINFPGGSRIITAIVPVDLSLEEEVRGESLRLQRHVPSRIGDRERPWSTPSKSVTFTFTGTAGSALRTALQFRRGSPDPDSLADVRTQSSLRLPFSDE